MRWLLLFEGIDERFNVKLGWIILLSSFRCFMSESRLSYLIYAIAENSDEFAFDELFRKYFPGLLSFARSFIKNNHQAEEIVEDVFVKLWNDRRILTNIHNLSHYLYIATKHACINFLKSSQNVPFEEVGDAFLFSCQTVETQIISNENVEAILQIVNSLPPKCRLIFRLVKDEGMKYSEIARLLNISERTVNAQMTIAFSRIIEHLKKSLPEFRLHYYKKRSG